MGRQVGHLGKAWGSWIPLLTKLPGLLIVVSPLTLLGDQHADDLCKAGIRVVNHGTHDRGDAASFRDENPHGQGIHLLTPMTCGASDMGRIVL